MIHINNTPITNYKNLEIFEEVSGSLTLSFTSFSMANNAHRYLNEEAVVTIAGYDFKIKQMTETTFSKSIHAVSTFFDLGGHYIDEMFAGTRYLDDLLTFTFKTTGWTYSLKAPNKLLTITNYGNDNALKLLLDLCKVAKIEYQIMPNNHVVFDVKIGPDKGAQYRYGYNIKTLSKNVDTTNLRTRIRGYGANGLNVIYTSPNASKFGIIEADPIHDDRFHIAENLVDYIKNQLQDEPLISIELDTVELINRELGEQIWLIYEPLDIEIKSRILSKRSVIRNGELVTESVVIGNSLPKSTSDLFAEQKLEYDTQNKVNRSKFEQINDRITLEVEELEVGLQANRAALDVTAKEIRAEVEEKITVTEENLEHVKSQVETLNTDLVEKINAVDIKAISNTSHLSQLATSLTSKIETEITRVDNKVDNFGSELKQTSSSLSSTMSSNYNTLQGRINTANSAINQWSDRINLKVDKNGVIGAINLSPERIDIDANKINFNGKVFGSSDAYFLGQVQAERIVGNEINGVRIRTSNASKYVHLENQELTLRDGGYRKMHIGFIDNNGNASNTPYIIMGQGQSNNRDRMVMEKFSHLFEMKYLALNGDSSIRMNYDGNLSINAVRTIYMNAERVYSYAPMQAPDFKPTSTVKLKTNISEFDDNAMDVVNRIGVYNYHMIQDLEDGIYDNQYLGFIAEGATEIKSGDAISLYKAVAFAWKALQEKDKEIKVLVKRVDDLEGVID